MYRLLSYLQTQKILPRMVEINHPSSCSSFQDRHKFTHTHTQLDMEKSTYIEEKKKTQETNIFLYTLVKTKEIFASVCMRKKTATRQDK